MPRIPTSALLFVALFASTRLTAVPLVPTSYTLNSSPWAYWDDTGGQLTDGLYNAIVPGSNLATPDAYNWVGWSNNNPSITFDFGQVVTITSASLSTVRWEPAGVYLPTSVTINSSVFAVNGVYTNMDKALLTFNGSWTGSTLNLTLDRGGTWTFLDEVTFDGHVGQPTNNVPDGGSTAAYAALAAGVVACIARRRRVKQS